MGITPEVKCSRCDRKYSALRARCPYCGARRRKQGKRVSELDNSIWKLVIGVLLLVVLIAAVVVLLVNALGKETDADTDAGKKPNSDFSSDEGTDSIDGTPIDGDDDGDNGDEGSGGEDGDDPGIDTPPVTNPLVQFVTILNPYSGNEFASGDEGPEFTLRWSNLESITLEYSVVPSDTTETPVWSSSDENVVVVLQTGEVKPVGRGKATIKIQVGTANDTVLVRVN